jgi:hypothetical protein
MLSPFLISPPKTSYPLLLTNPLTPNFLSWHSHTLRHQTFSGPRVSPPTDAQLGHPLLHMQVKPWVPPFVPFGWWFSPWELWGYWLFYIVVPPMGLPTPLAPLVLSLAPPLGTLCSVQWLAESIHLCICQAILLLL